MNIQDYFKQRAPLQKPAPLTPSDPALPEDQLEMASECSLSSSAIVRQECESMLSVSSGSVHTAKNERTEIKEPTALA